MGKVRWETCRRCGARVRAKRDGTFRLWYLPYHKNPKTKQLCGCIDFGEA
jgi:hypothetical protein